MYLRRQKVCDLLRMSVRASYRAWNRLRPRQGMVSSRDLADMLNRAARAGQKKLCDCELPNAMTAEEVEAETGFPARTLLLATRRTRNPIPHWRINSHVIRFHLPAVINWIEGK